MTVAFATDAGKQLAGAEALHSSSSQSGLAGDWRVNGLAVARRVVPLRSVALFMSKSHITTITSGQVFQNEIGRSADISIV